MAEAVLLNFKEDPMPAEIPGHLRRDSYKILWGAGDFWILTNRYFELYDVFVSFGAPGVLPHVDRVQGAPNLVVPADGIDVLLENRRRAAAHNKIIVYIDVREEEQLEAFANLFQNSVRLFEELGVHNSIHDDFSSIIKMLKKIMKIGGNINLSYLDFLCDGSTSSSIFNNIGFHIETRCNRYFNHLGENNRGQIRIGPLDNADPRVIPIRENLLTTIRNRTNNFKLGNLNLETLSFNELVFIVGILTFHAPELQTKFGMNYEFIFNKTPRLHSNESIIRVTIKKIRDLKTNLFVEKFKRNKIKTLRNKTWRNRRHLIKTWRNSHYPNNANLSNAPTAAAGAATGTSTPRRRRNTRRRR